MAHGTIGRLGLIVKERPDGDVKRRKIIDLKHSHGNDDNKASLPEKLVLPGRRDAYEKRQPYSSDSTYIGP